MISALALFVAHLSPDVRSVNADQYSCLKWRNIGPFRGGRTVGACGIADQPNTFYIGVNNGGVWTTTDAGRTWKPIFDDQPTGSIGDVQVAASNPNVLYVGSGEGLQRPDLSTGNGMYKSLDGGKTWQHIGLEDAWQIGGVAIDPKDPEHVLVAALGHPYGPNTTRGVYQTQDGGKSWFITLVGNPDTGAVQVTFDPSNPSIVYADLWEARQAPWENGAFKGSGSGLYKSTDGGTHWTMVGQGLPTTDQGLGRVGFAVAPSNGNILYATLEAQTRSGIYRSEDAGKSFKLVNEEPRLYGRGDDFAEIKVDPKNADIVYVANTSTYRSTDCAKTFTCIKGAPGGDDYHRIWINPLHPEIILLASDQGATVSVNGGETWSSWYNQPTAQFYHVSTDNLFPYNVYGGQQESGSAMVSSRGNDGQITFREWHPAGGDEYGYLACDPLHPRYVYGGRINRFDKVTGEVEDVRPKVAFRTLRTAPVLFSPADPHTLYFAGNMLFRTRDGGAHWDTISPDLSRETYEIPDSVGKYRTEQMKTMPRRGVIYTVAPSPKDKGLIWCGTDDGLIWVTRDSGKHWANVTPPSVTSWSKVSLMDAGHFDKGTAYAAVNRIRCDDPRPHIFVTHDFGKTWSERVAGLPNDPINVVREDPKRPGLLFSGSETAVHFSIDDGLTWQPLRLNMPATSVRDLVIHEDDLAIGTHGRGFWILDNFSILRSIPAAGDFLVKPPTAYLLERNTNTDTPLPAEEPAAQNPPDGAMLDYYLAEPKAKASIEIMDAKGSLVRRFGSDDVLSPVDPQAITVMPGWALTPQPLSVEQGSHRFVWDLRGIPAKGSGGRGGLPISAVWGKTPYSSQGPMVSPGQYTVRLTVDGRVFEQKLTVKADPRGKGGNKGMTGAGSDDDEP